jgi:hypothetical protein
MSLLEPYYYRAGVTLELLGLDVIEGQEEFKVKLILVHKEQAIRRQYLVR